MWAQSGSGWHGKGTGGTASRGLLCAVVLGFVIPKLWLEEPRI